MPSKEREPAPLSAERWAELAKPLRRYAPAGSAAAAWEHDFRLRVDEVVALFRDRETPAGEWVNRALPLFELAIRTAGSHRRSAEIAASMPHLLSARAKSPPRRATALAALREVEASAARLAAAIEAAILDPWLNATVGSEVIRREARKFSAELHSSPPAKPVAESVFADTRDALVEGAAQMALIRQAAKQGVNLLRGHQLRGRPPETGARIPALLLCAVAKHHAPAPGRGAIQRWRGDLFSFVCDVLSATGLPRVSPEFVERALR